MPHLGHRFRKTPNALIALGIVAVLAAGTPPLAEAKTAKRKHAATQRSRAQFDKGSGETTAERDRRLLRECKGRPNAGACLGYAS